MNLGGGGGGNGGGGGEVAESVLLSKRTLIHSELSEACLSDEVLLQFSQFISVLHWPR